MRLLQEGLSFSHLTERLLLLAALLQELGGEPAYRRGAERSALLHLTDYTVRAEESLRFALQKSAHPAVFGFPAVAPVCRRLNTHRAHRSRLPAIISGFRIARRNIKGNTLSSLADGAAVCSTSALSASAVLSASGNLTCGGSDFCASALPSCLVGVCGSTCGVPNVTGYALLDSTFGVDYGGLNVSFTSSVGTVDQCASSCNRTAACFAFFYDFRAQTCALKSSANAASRVAAPGGGFFVKGMPTFSSPSTSFVYPETSTLFSTRTARMTLTDCAQACIGLSCPGIVFDASVPQCRGLTRLDERTAASSNVASGGGANTTSASLLLSFERVVANAPRPPPPRPSPPKPSPPPVPPPLPPMPPSPPPSPPNPPAENGTIPVRTAAGFLAALMLDSSGSSRIVLQTDITDDDMLQANEAGGGQQQRRRRAKLADVGDASLVSVNRPGAALWLEGDSSGPCFNAGAALSVAGNTSSQTAAVLASLASNPGRCRTLRTRGLGRLMTMTATSVTLKHLVIVGGSAQGPGGCLQLAGIQRLVIDNVVFYNCSSLASVRATPLPISCAGLLLARL